jgi:hypothetical protein
LLRTISNADFSSSACSIASSTTSTTASIASLPQTGHVDTLPARSAPQFLQWDAERVVDGKGHHPPFPKRVKCWLFAPGGAVRSEVDHLLDRRYFFARFDRALRRFSCAGDGCGPRADLDREFVYNILVNVLRQILDHGFAQLQAARQQQIAAFELRHDQLNGVGEYARLVLHRFGHHYVRTVFRPAVSERLVRFVSLYLQHLLDLPDLADEKPAEFLRQQREDEAVVLISRPRQRPEIGSWAQPNTVRQGHRYGDLPPQAQFLVREERHTTTERGEFGL